MDRPDGADLKRTWVAYANELEAENAKLKVLESLVLELVEDYTITDKRVRAALEGEQ